MDKATKKTISKKASAKKVAPAKKAAKPAVVKKEVSAEISKISEISKSLREFRFGAAGSKAKNTAQPKMMRKARAQALTAESAAKKLAI
jgi:ribosomal protein L29